MADATDFEGDVDEVIDDETSGVEEPEDGIDEEIDEEIDDEYELEDVGIDDGEDADEEDDEEGDEDAPAALDELEAEELDMVDEDAPQTMLVDEASEIRAIRRQELTLDVEAESQQSDEFVCSSCFLVLKRSQLANKRKMLCVDCA